MEFKINKYLPKSKEELPPINRLTRSSTSNQILKVGNYKIINKN